MIDYIPVWTGTMDAHGLCGHLTSYQGASSLTGCMVREVRGLDGRGNPHTHARASLTALETEIIRRLRRGDSIRQIMDGVGVGMARVRALAAAHHVGRRKPGRTEL